MQPSERVLIVITGPVGGGKSSTALALSRCLQQDNRLVAAIDLDRLEGFVRQTNEPDDDTAWQRARRGAAGLAMSLFDAGMSVVIVEGEFFTTEELNALLESIPASIPSQVFTLEVSYARMCARVQNDPTRGMSKNPAFLRAMSVKFGQALPLLRQASTCIDADTLTLDDVVRQLVGLVPR
jgi:hypothetical protein